MSYWIYENFWIYELLVFKKAQELEGLILLKILECATTQWHSPGAAAEGVILWFSPLIDALDTIYLEKHDTDMKGVWDLLLRPNVILFMLSLAKVLVYVDRFLCFLQICFLIYTQQYLENWLNSPTILKNCKIKKGFLSNNIGKGSWRSQRKCWNLADSSTWQKGRCYYWWDQKIRNDKKCTHF